MSLNMEEDNPLKKQKDEAKPSDPVAKHEEEKPLKKQKEEAKPSDLVAK